MRTEGKKKTTNQIYCLQYYVYFYNNVYFANHWYDANQLGHHFSYSFHSL